MPHVTFERDYNHKWPSRAVTAFKAGWSGRVKQEVADAAVPDFATMRAKPEVVETDDSQ